MSEAQGAEAGGPDASCAILARRPRSIRSPRPDVAPVFLLTPATRIGEDVGVMGVVDFQRVHLTGPCCAGTRLPAAPMTTASAAHFLKGASAMDEDQVVAAWLYGLAQNTQHGYRADLASFRASIGGKALGDVTLGDVQAFDTGLAKRGAAKSSRARKLSALRSLYAFAVVRGFCQKNPALAVRLPRSRDGLADRILTVAQVRALLDAARSRFPVLPPGRDLFTRVELAKVFGLRGPRVVAEIATRHGWRQIVKRVEVRFRRRCPRNRPPVYALRLSRAHVRQLLAERGCAIPNLAKTLPVPEVAQMAALSCKRIKDVWRDRGWHIGVDYACWNVREGAWVRKELRPVVFYARGDAERLLYRSPTYRDYVLLVFLYQTGVRISEALGARWRDFGQQDDGTAVVTIYGKGEKTRVLCLLESCWALLATLRETSRPEDPVFQASWRTRRPLGREHFTRTCYKIAELAGLDVRPTAHWLRHCHASHALDNGCPWHLVKAQLGHASITSTERYVHARPGETSSSYLPPDGPDNDQNQQPRLLKMTEARTA